MPTSATLLQLDASTLSRRIAARELSCRELMQASLERIAALNPVHNAIVSLRPAEALLAEADARDTALARGEPAGWMHGFPIAIKDLSDAEGLPTTRGSPAVGQRMATADALFVLRMKKAGAIVIGKTNTPEFGLGAALDWPKAIAGVTMDTYHRWMEIVTPFTLAALPVASVPVGFNAAGLPMGMQLAGPARADFAVLALARAFEAIAPWTTKRPPALAALA